MGRAAPTIEIENTTRQRYSLAFLRRVAEITLTELGVGEAELSIVLVGEKRMATLNQQYRKKAGPTNVLAFPYVDTKGTVHGDVIVCGRIAEKEAKTLGVTTRTRLAALVVHGIVHIAGYTHETDAKAEKMEALERRIAHKARFSS